MIKYIIQFSTRHSTTKKEYMEGAMVICDDFIIDVGDKLDYINFYNRRCDGKDFDNLGKVKILDVSRITKNKYSGDDVTHENELVLNPNDGLKDRVSKIIDTFKLIKMKGIELDSWASSKNVASVYVTIKDGEEKCS